LKWLSEILSVLIRSLYSLATEDLWTNLGSLVECQTWPWRQKKVNWGLRLCRCDVTIVICGNWQQGTWHFRERATRSHSTNGFPIPLC
jgi:hypothetical protein